MMNRSRVMVALILAFCASEALAQAVVQVPRIATSPLIDGRVTTAEWGSAAKVDPFVDADSGTGVQAQTQVYLAHDGQTLYIAFRCFEPQMDQLQTVVADRDGTLWNDDCVEVFLDVAGKRESFAHFIVNPIGAQYDAMGSDASWNCRWLALTGREQDAWTVEVSIPVAELGVKSIKPADLWFGNFCRSRHAGSELSSWNRTGASFASPKSFGALIFDSFSLRAASDNDVLLSALGRLTQELQGSPFVAPETLSEAKRLTQTLQQQSQAFGREWTREEYLQAQSNYDEAGEMVKRLEFAGKRRQLENRPYLL
ncbi:MAG TPA: sugar-binding protein, partial [bacterium]|nr:sugar-binding protein [bacterium]